VLVVQGLHGGNLADERVAASPGEGAEKVVVDGLARYEGGRELLSHPEAELAPVPCPRVRPRTAAPTGLGNALSAVTAAVLHLSRS
jgi:hypothetical protein